MAKFDAETDHGRVVWAKMSKSSQSWPAMVISTKILNLLFKEKPNKIWVYWLGENTFSHLDINLLFDFCEDFKSHFGNPNVGNFQRIALAVEILSLQYGFELPDAYIMSIDYELVSWVTSNLKNLTNRNGKRKRGETFQIPTNIIENINMINSKNMKTAIQDNIKNEICTQNGQNKVRNSKRKLKYCISCRDCLKEKENFYSHPVFEGTICESCYEKAGNVLMTISNNGSNKNCCICFNHNLQEGPILCEICVRIYCKECLSIYIPKISLNKIIKTKSWRCLVHRNDFGNKSLVSHTMDKQLKNFFSFFPACDTNKIKKFTKKTEVQIFAIEDVQNNVPAVLNQLKHPFKLLDAQNLHKLSIDHDIHETITPDKSDHIKLLIQYYPNKKNYDKEKFNKCTTIDTFLNFILKRDRLQLKYPNKILFWAFETSAAIKHEEQKFISRFCGKNPILTTMYSRDIQQIGRFIWTNLTIYEKDVAQFRKHNIFRKIKRENQNDEDERYPWCFESVNVILTSLIKNYIK